MASTWVGSADINRHRLNFHHRPIADDSVAVVDWQSIDRQLLQPLVAHQSPICTSRH
jgi:hypothetical protein